MTSGVGILRWQLVICVMALLATPPCFAEVFTVLPDGTGEYATIDDALDVAGDGMLWNSRLVTLDRP